MKINPTLLHSFVIASAFLATLSARAESYRFMNVEVRGAEGMSEVSKALGDKTTWPAFTTNAAVTLKNIVVVNIGADGSGSFDESYALKYADNFDEAGKPKGFTARKVGSYASVKRLPNGLSDVRLTITSLERWMPIASGKSTLQPVFNTREMNAVAKLPADETPAILGGQTREVTGADGKPEKVSTVLIVQRFKPTSESAEPPATLEPKSTPSADPFRSGK